MQVVRHDHKGVEFVASSITVSQHIKHEPRPMVVAKEGFAARCLGGDEVGVFTRPNCLSPGTHPIPSGAKAPPFLADSMYGLKPVPFTTKTFIQRLKPRYHFILK